MPRYAMLLDIALLSLDMGGWNGKLMDTSVMNEERGGLIDPHKEKDE